MVMAVVPMPAMAVVMVGTEQVTPKAALMVPLVHAGHMPESRPIARTGMQVSVMPAMSHLAQRPATPSAPMTTQAANILFA